MMALMVCDINIIQLSQHFMVYIVNDKIINGKDIKSSFYLLFNSIHCTIINDFVTSVSGISDA